MYTTLISADQLAASLDNANVSIFDCRFSLADTNAGRNAYKEGHIPGAIYAHLDDDLSGEIVPGKTGRHPLPALGEITATFSKWGIDKQVQVVAYDDKGGMIASRLWWMLKWLGHEAVAVLDGGWQAWQVNGHPVSSEIVQPEPRNFSASPQDEMILPLQDMIEKSAAEQALILDARAAERYRGETEPIDPVAGHIPAAISAPFAMNLDEQGYFLSPEKLKARFEALLGKVPAEEAVCYCGSGVSGCHNLLAATHAGIKGIKLFPGSWSEWIVDPQRPVATGPEPA